MIKVSVGIPVYNEGKHLSQLLHAVSAQTYVAMEIIVSDNASTDNTWEIIQEYAAKDNRFKIVRHPKNMGAHFNFKYVLERATGEYFIWAGGHDVWGEGVIASCVGHLDANPHTMLCVPQTRWMDESGKLLPITVRNVDTCGAPNQAERILRFFRQMDRCSAIYGLHRRASLIATLPWPKVIGPDFITLLRIAKKGDIVTDHGTFWCRRKNRVEKPGEAQQRQIKTLGISGMAAKYPNLCSRLAVIREVCPTTGGLISRLKLIGYFTWRLFFRPEQFRILLKELVLPR